MKKLLLIFFTFLLAHNIFSQVVFCPPGAEWRYLYYIGLTNQYFPTTMHYSGDTIIGNESIKILNYGYFYKSISLDYCHNVFIRQRGDTVFMRNCETSNTWQILYNFAATVGQYWTTTVKDSGAYGSHIPYTYTITVNSISTVTINNISLKKQNVSYCVSSTPSHAAICYTADIVERIGCTTFLFNYINNPTVSDREDMSDFLCYTDDSLGTVSYSQKPCNYTIGIKETQLNAGTLKLYPQPANNDLSIEFNTNSPGINYTAQLSDISGRKALTTTLSSSKTNLDLSGLNGGIYFLQVFDQQKLLTTRKIIKN